MGVQQKVSGSCAVTVSAPGRCSHVIPGTECTIYVTDTVYGVRDLRQSSRHRTRSGWPSRELQHLNGIFIEQFMCTKV